ncbi:HTH-type transcriptional regulator MalT [compost metagenome]
MLALAEFGCGQPDQARARLQGLLATCKRLRFRGLMAEAQVALARMEADQGGGYPGKLPDLAPTSLLAGWVNQGVSPVRLKSGTRDELTTREFSVLQLVAQGLSNQEISERLFISLNTVKAHTVNINQKLGVKRRTQAVMRAKSMGVLA